jgi:hypothetical protein
MKWGAPNAAEPYDMQPDLQRFGEEHNMNSQPLLNQPAKGLRGKMWGNIRRNTESGRSATASRIGASYMNSNASIMPSGFCIK